jgi:hypothetical protein
MPARQDAIKAPEVGMLELGEELLDGVRRALQAHGGPHHLDSEISKRRYRRLTSSVFGRYSGTRSAHLAWIWRNGILATRPVSLRRRKLDAHRLSGLGAFATNTVPR